MMTTLHLLGLVDRAVQDSVKHSQVKVLQMVLQGKEYKECLTLNPNNMGVNL